MNIGFLISPNSWFLDFFTGIDFDYDYKLYLNHEDLDDEDNIDVLFILSYFRIIPNSYLNLSKRNLVVHESNLPLGRGWAPYFWQILEGENKIPICLLEAASEVDSGNVLIRDHIILNGTELNSELREKQGLKTIEICIRYIKDTDIKGIKQEGTASFYPKRTTKDSELDVEKSISEQFNLLRIVNNESYPAFFDYLGEKYVIKIEKST